LTFLQVISIRHREVQFVPGASCGEHEQAGYERRQHDAVSDIVHDRPPTPPRRQRIDPQQDTSAGKRTSEERASWFR
jgi:hypothetical protein